ncbi:DNA repair protein RecO [Thermovibrio ammonificans]
MKFRAFVLKSAYLGKGLRALTVYGEKVGSHSLIVKVPKEEFPLKYEPFSLTFFSVKELGEKREVVGARLIRSHFPSSVAQFKYRFKLTGLLVGKQLPWEERLFKLLESYLPITSDFKLAYLMFLLKFTYIEGLYPVLNRCVVCGSFSFNAFSLKEGGVVCERCASGGELPWSYRDSKLALRLTKLPFKEAKGLHLPGEGYRRLVSAFEKHLAQRTQ